MDGTVGATYETNPGAEFVKGDVRKLDPEDMVDCVDRGRSDLLLAGCAPCRPFSRHAKESARDGRRSLMGRFAEVVAAVLPDHILAENVPMFTGCRYHVRMRRALDACGYWYDNGVVDAADYRVYA